MLSEAAAKHLPWLFDKALPLWFERGVDWQRGGFYDQLDQNAARNAVDFKRLRVLARQIYVFSEAVSLGWEDGRRAVAHGLEFLLGRARRPDGGYALRFDLDGNVTDDRRDLYDLAFTLLALAQARLKDEALALVDYLDRTLRHSAGGFAEGAPASLPRRHNGHMHLLEALLACVANGWGAPFAEGADRIATLFRDRFFSAGFLPEEFSETLAPLAGPLEPGHYDEWCWLLDRWSRLRQQPPSGEADALYRFARRFGAASPGAPVVDALAPDGRVERADARLWPQAERARTMLGREPAAASRAFGVLFSYLDAARIGGLWRERRYADGSWSDEPAPASSLYHIVGAMAELSRRAGVRDK